MRIPLSKSRRRAAFTLIEMLVVIAIIAILAALTAGALFRLSTAQNLKHSEATVKKVQSGFDGQWKAAIDDAKEETKKHKVRNVMAAFVAAGVSDSDTANELYVLMKLKIEFPQTFNEARFPGLAAFGLQPKAVYVNELGGAAATNAPEESAVLLYLALSQTRRGAVFNVDEIGGAVKVLKVGGKEFKVIADAWGTPITFQRFAQDAGWAHELWTIAGGPTGGKDPQDPSGKLEALPNGPKAYFQSLLADLFNWQGGQQYHGPVIRSAGPDKSFATTNDDILGFRLLQEGQRGN